MEQTLIQLFQVISWAGVGGMFVYFVLRPWTHYYINRKNGVSTNVEKRIHKVENNDLHEVNRRLKVLDESDIRMEGRLNKISEDVAWLKAKVNNK